MSNLGHELNELVVQGRRRRAGSSTDLERVVGERLFKHHERRIDLLDSVDPRAAEDQRLWRASRPRDMLSVTLCGDV